MISAVSAGGPAGARAPLVSIRISGRGSEPTNGRGVPEGDRHADTRAEQRRSYTETVLPKHVRHCSGTGARDWAIYTWNPLNPALVTRSPYMCNSWRCPVCRRHEAAVSFARTKAAFLSIPDWDPERLGFFVLTLDRDGWYSGKPWSNERAAYAALGMMARKFLKRLNRLALRQGVEPPGNRWVATVEAHKTGWPHYQLIIYLPPEWSEELPTGDGFRLGWSDLQDDIRAHACRVGWGKVSSFERARDALAAMGYLIGTAGKHEASIGELAKITQLPLNAPARFRRLRSGKGFLPPRWKGANTGTLIRRRQCEDGTFQAEALHELKNQQAREVSAQCCYQEERIWEAERGFGAFLRPEILALMPGLKEELLPRMVQFRPTLPRAPPVIPAPVSLAPALSWSQAVLPLGRA